MKKNVLFILGCVLIIFICLLVSKYVLFKVNGYTEMLNHVEADTVLKEKVDNLSNRNHGLPFYYAGLAMILLFTRFYIKHKIINASVYTIVVVATLYLLFFETVLSVENLYLYALMPITVLWISLFNKLYIKKVTLRLLK